MSAYTDDIIAEHGLVGTETEGGDNGPVGLSAYLPDWIARASAELSSAPDTPIEQRQPGVVMICDVSGFTALGEKLAARGSEGAEMLWRNVNAYFGAMLAKIDDFGGDVLRFAGDAPVVFWPASADELPEIVARACACGLEQQKSYGQYETDEGVVLQMRVGIAAGDLLATWVGGVQGRWEPFVAGRPITDLESVLTEAEKGDVVVARDAWALVSDRVDGEATPSGHGRVASVQGVAAVDPEPAAPNVAAETLRAFIPRTVLRRLDAGHAAWIAELRRVTVLFLEVDGIDYTAEDATERLHDAAGVLQRAVYRYDGSVNQFMMDDKGTVLVALWGLPGRTHEDDAARAVHAGMTAVADLQAIGLGGSAGVSTGRAFCGERGSPTRREYGTLGAAINLGARLMQHADGAVLCEARTAQAAADRIEFDRIPQLSVKGKKGITDAYRPHHPVRIAKAQRPMRPMAGRTGERRALEEELDALKTGEGGAVLIEGEAGIGKSRLVATFLDAARERGLPVLLGEADSIERHTAYHGFRGVFDELMGVDPAASTASRRAAAQRWLDERGLDELAPLFNAVLRLDLPDNERTAAMDGEARGNTIDTVYIEALSTQSPLIVVIEDLHWLDSSSWDLLRIAMGEIKGALFVMTTRPPGLPVPAEHARLLTEPDLNHLLLGPLDADDVVELVAERLGARSISPEVAAIIRDRAEGHPFYSEEIAYALRDRGFIEFRYGEVHMAPGVDAADVELPSTLEGIIASRLDGLTPVQHLCLKTASVVGREFAYDMLSGIYPVDEQRGELPSALDAVSEMGLTDIESLEPHLSYLFHHGITQEVAYSQLLFQQRRDLHRAAAEWYETDKAENLAPFLPLLAYHWRRADVKQKAIDALHSAGEQALRSFANAEAISFMTAAAELDDDDDGKPDPRRARRQRVIGEAKARIGKLEEATEHLSRAAVLLGQPLPRTTFGTFVAFAIESLRQVYRRYRGAPDTPAADREAVLTAANTFQELGLMAYFAGKPLLLMYGVVRSLNLAEDAGPSPDLARMKAAMAIVVSGVPMHRAAESYSTEAIEVADQFDDYYARANARHYRGAYLVGMGDFNGVPPLCEPAVVDYERVGNSRRRDESVHCLLYAGMNQERYDEVERCQKILADSARRRDDEQVRFWVRTNAVELAWRRGNFDAAVEMVDDIRETEETDDQIYINRLRGLRVHVLLDAGHTDRAIEAAGVIGSPGRPTSFLEMWMYTSLAELHLRQWAAGESSARRPARRACKALETFAGIFHLGQTQALYYRGRCAQLDGRDARAKQAWTEALELCRARVMPFEERRLLDALGRAGEETR